MSNRNKTIVEETLARWRETILNTSRADVDGAKKLLRAAAKNAQIFVVDTPLQFFIAQAVMRKRVSKKVAKERLCPIYEISSDFIDEIAVGAGAPTPFVGGRWDRQGIKNMVDATWIHHMRSICDSSGRFEFDIPDDSRKLLHGPNRWRRVNRNEDEINLQNMLAYQMCDFDTLYHRFEQAIASKKVYEQAYAGEVKNADDMNVVRYTLNFNTNAVRNSYMTISSAVSSHGEDIVNGQYSFNAHAFDATQAEILYKITNCKDPIARMYHEIFHFVPAIMQFRRSFLLLAERPKISLNADNQLHSTSAPAVMYPDGSGFWYVDGHLLEQAGPQIILSPETLTGKAINALRNEEERRIAIERMGWDKYLVDVDAKVVHSRENWIDNTFEALIATPSGNGRDSDQLRALLACRSTGRRYFLAIPETTESSYWRRDKAKPILNCEDVQKWMANGATSEFLPYAAHEVRVVGAS